MSFRRSAWLSAVLLASATVPVSGQQSAYTVPGAFPTSLYSQYYNNPTATSEQPQPVISDPVTHEVFPYSLTNPNVIPQNDTSDPHPFPPVAGSSKILEQAIAQVKSISANPIFGTNQCARCQASLEAAKFLALSAPDQGSNFAVALCEYFNYSSSCEANYGPLTLGPMLTQVMSFADVGGYDGQLLCAQFLGLCSYPDTLPLNITGWFAKPKPNPLPVLKQPSGERLKVLHVSDLHIDPRKCPPPSPFACHLLFPQAYRLAGFANGAEANCTSGLCCRVNAYNRQSPQTPLLPAPRFGYFLCDSPYSLIAATLEAIPPLAGTETTGFNFTLFTGDLLAHDPDIQQSRAYTEYSEVVLFDLLKRMLGPGPVYATLGNHDSYPSDLAASYSLGGMLGQQFGWLYDHVTALWNYEGWLPEDSVEYSRAHYAAYMVKRTDGLRIISLNTNLCASNYFNYINASHPDTSGMMRFLTDELQDAEDAGDRAWIIGHVVSGWDGSNALLNPTDLCAVDRFSPHVIANIFWGHTHEDQVSIYYTNNATVMNTDTAQTLSWACSSSPPRSNFANPVQTGPSVTPLTNLNTGFRVYEIDSATFEVLDAYTYNTPVNTFSALGSQIQYGPTFELEYSTRETYGANIPWGDNDPLNATWWQLVTERESSGRVPDLQLTLIIAEMVINSTLVEIFNTYQGKSSILTPPCTGECVTARICYIRSGSASIALQNCPHGYGSVQ
ncbi:sphingomyelin phosphodiesterase [Lanmaoa asiatica]|nr:sphingomyelin phosphodiesterase [Lanmaoa asiatica]